MTALLFAVCKFFASLFICKRPWVQTSLMNCYGQPNNVLYFNRCRRLKSFCDLFLDMSSLTAEACRALNAMELGGRVS